jgi:hypothetical protein
MVIKYEQECAYSLFSFNYETSESHLKINVIEIMTFIIFITNL